MRKITEEELKKILENHKHWLEEDCEVEAGIAPAFGRRET